IPSAGRAEFIVTGPPPSVKNAEFLTLNVDTGPGGDIDPQRPLASIVTGAGAPDKADPPAFASFDPGARMPANWGRSWPQRFEGLDNAKVTATRTLYFSERVTHPPDTAPDTRDSDSNTLFFITVVGQIELPFSSNNPPAITTTQGSVEDWTIQNRTSEVHEFHIHQIHFLLLAINGVPVPKAQRQFLDTVQVPYWTGSGPFPSVTVRMDFRGPDIGDFVYHCHILAHEDGGMMAIIRVLPKDAATTSESGRFGSIFAAIGRPPREGGSAWCVRGRSIERSRGDGLRDILAAQALIVGSFMTLFLAGAVVAPRAAGLMNRGAGE
ncbi:MAG TPA: multicopper oxidase domain-containing protein, partial [Candidatus Binataceae bacterium]|nr:multicopper oxidase domain-containing protein [Candidatus Binataceae bacterium]